MSATLAQIQPAAEIAPLIAVRPAPVPAPIPCIDVCIATYRRPGSLAALLGSLSRQETDGAFRYRLIVVDNDRLRSGEQTVRRFAAEGLDITYAVEPRQNIALARNLGFGLATSELIATIDDDEVAPPGWLRQLLVAMRAHDADVVRGRVAYVFAGRVSPLVIRSRAFDYPNPETGASEGFAMGTGNMLIRRDALDALPTLLDPALGRTGGSDGELFRRMKAAGSKIIWCREAASLEIVSPARATWRRIFVHEFRLGNNFDQVRHQPPQRLRAGLWDVAREVSKMLGCAARAPFGQGRLDAALIHLRESIRKLGRLSVGFGVRLEEYTESGPRLIFARRRHPDTGWTLPLAFGSRR